MDYRDLMWSMGGPAQAFQNVDAHRAGIAQDPRLFGMSQQELSPIDRYMQMAQFGEQFGPNAPWYKRAIAPGVGLVGAGALGMNELSKSVPGVQNLLANITGDQSFVPDQTSSQPSYDNFMSGMSGMFEGMAPGLFR